MERRIRKRIGETFEKQVKARKRHLAEIANGDLQRVKTTSGLSTELNVQVNENEVMQHLKEINEGMIERNKVTPMEDLVRVYSYPFVIEFDSKRSHSNVYTSDQRIIEYLRAKKKASEKLD